MTIILKNSEELVVNLISVTKRGDYIVEILNDTRYENTEVLVNHSEIQKVILQLKQYICGVKKEDSHRFIRKPKGGFHC